MAFIVEHSPDKHRGLAGSSVFFSMCVGILVGSGVGSFFASALSTADFESWGWRIPFIIGIAIGFVGFYIRKHCDESPKYEHAKKTGILSKTPVRDAFRKHPKEILMGMLIYLTVTVPFYVLVVFLNTFMSKMLGKSVDEALLINTISMFVLTFFIPVSAIISDKVGRKPVLLISSISYIIFAYPCFMMLGQEGFVIPLMGQMLFAFICAFFLGPVPTLLVEMFPTNVRYTGMALSYNFAAAFFGGTTPMVSTWLIQQTGNNNIVAVYVMLCTFITIITLYFFKDRFNRPLS